MLKKFDSFAWMGIMIIGVMITIMTTPMRIQDVTIKDVIIAIIFVIIPGIISVIKIYKELKRI